MSVLTLDLQEGRWWGDCPMCGQERRLDHGVGWWCGPTRLDIGAKFTATDGSEHEVGGMCVCKPCHDLWYGVHDAAALARATGGSDGE